MDPLDPYASRGLDPYGRPRSQPNPTPQDDATDESLEDEATEPSDDEPLEFSDDMLAEPARQRSFDFERGMSRVPPFTIALIVLLTIVFVWELGSGALRDKESIMRAGALEKNAVVQRGEWWRIPASMHLHGSFEHLLGNCFGLFLLGLAVEHAYGLRAAVAMYFLAGTAGALASLVMEGGPTVGASGAIFGWWGAAVVFYYRYQGRLLARDKRVGFVLLIWAGWAIFTGFLNPQISNFSHLGGFLAGAMLALLTPTRILELREPVENL